MQDFNKDKEVAAKKHTHWRLYYIHVTSTQFSLILPSETFLTNFADLSVYVHDINLVFYHIPKVDWDRITAKASCIQRSHCHAWETSLRSFEVCDMVPYVRITLWCKGHCKRCSFKLWHLNDAHGVNLMATYQRWGSHHGVAKLILL